MDDSADFQDKKKSIVRPNKIIKKNTDLTVRNKRKVRKIKGQKDIRTALNPKKSDLVKYSKEFNEVCQLSGIDVDSEQLQIAIALSNSLQKCDIDSTLEAQTSKSCCKQDNIIKIRTTLQEYGFKVPEITLEKKKHRRKKPNKHYKLLTVSEQERQQIIADKYSQILFTNLSTQEGCEEISVSKTLYNLATNILYSEIKDLNTFYVKGLLEVSPNSTGNLLKDWSTIPGRPQSPCQTHKKHKQFSNLSCSQLELDKILSGSILSAQSIIKDKTEADAIASGENMHEENIVNIDLKEKVIMEVNIESSSNKNTLGLKTNHARCCSPDIFDDEIDDTTLENTRNNHDLIVSTAPITTIQSINDFMDLTECIPQTSQNITRHIILSQGTNLTRRKSNDFMEITSCIACSSQPILVHNPGDEYNCLPSIEEDDKVKFKELISNESPVQKEMVVNNIDLTQDSPVNKTVEQDGNNTEIIDKIDLSQTSDSCDALPVVHFNNRSNDLCKTIVIEDNEYKLLKTPTKLKPIEIESDDEFDYNLGPKDIKTVYSNKEDILDLTLELQKSPEDIKTVNSNKEYILDLTLESQNCPEDVKTVDSNKEDLFDLTLELQKNPEDVKTVDSNKEDIFDLTLELQKNPDQDNKDHSFSSKDNSIENASFYKNTDSVLINENVSPIKKLHIDLTQNESICYKNTSNKVSFESLGKRDDVSVDYDEICIDNNSGIIEYIPDERSALACDENEGNHSKIFQENIPQSSFTYNETYSNDNLSQQTDVFEIYDNELDYSMQQSRLENQKENFQTGGISILDNLSKRNSKSFCSNRISRSISESFLPEVNIIKKIIKKAETKRIENPVTGKSQPSTPCKNFSSDVINPIETPKSAYIIKTDQVTPMVDYASLSTPDRNIELEKYGLKPFKRKRAIQLLTHLYNQTHPIVEHATEDQPSPSKKLRKDINSQTSSPTKTVEFPKKAPNRSKSANNEGTNKENTRKVGYEVTNPIPEISNVECDPDDWVFQKREKAKIQSCRLPLHIAFHNYVSCRKGLQEAILQYEPVHIDLIHKDFVAMGLKYDPKELLKFLDKKCITVKTADNNSRNIKKI